MRVKCRLCEHESNEFCTTKTNNSKPIKIQLNKPRSCSSYKEDGLRVLAEYRRTEAHKKSLKQVQSRNSQLQAAIAQIQADLASRKEGLTVEEPTQETSDDV